MTLSNKILGLQPSATLRIHELSNKLAEEGKEIFKLGFGQSPFPVPDVLVDELKNKAHHKEYLPVRGLQSLQQKVAAYYRRDQYLNCDGDDILIGPGSKMYLFISLMVHEGDLLLAAPSWVSYAPQATINGRRVFWLPTVEENNWKLTTEDLHTFCKTHQRPKILLLNYPNNPTGTTYNLEELKDITLIAQKYGVIVLSDEIYGELQHEGKHVSIAQYYPEGTIISSGLSKWAGAGGWRLGTCIFPKELTSLKNAMATVASETFTIVSAPIQYAAIKAFEVNPNLESYRLQSRHILKTIGNYTYQTLTDMNITTPAPQGGFYSFINFQHHRKNLAQRGITNSIELSDRLLQETGIALLPGVDFGREKNELLFRMAYVDFDGDAALNAFRPNEGLNDEFPENFIQKYAPKMVRAMEKLERWL
jgi:aspartate/methionine/tyrosine aminotransferase